MWKSNLITALRVLARNRAITPINVIGLSAALAVTILCLLFVRHETSFDTWHERGPRIFAVYFEYLEPNSGPALGTVSGQTWLAARTNPADALRHE